MIKLSGLADFVITLFHNKWLRRLVLILIGVTMGVAYFGRQWNEVYYTPFTLGFIVGLFSGRVLEGYINAMIVLISMVSVVIIYWLAAFLGASEQDWNFLSFITSTTFVVTATLFLTRLPGTAFGLFARYLVLKSTRKI